MSNRNNVWAGWTEKSFDPDKYIYHYTSFETALKILYNDCLLFSPFARTNDTAEQKSKLFYDFVVEDNQKDDIALFEKYWLEWSKKSRLLCFSRDRSKMDKNRLKDLQKSRFEMSGRGFALPRMWAQYAKNHCGVCLIFRKGDLVDKAKSIYPDCYTGDVAYCEWYDRVPVTRDFFEKVVQIIKADSNSYAPTILNNYCEFRDYSFFTKLRDWAGENEFRIVIPYNGEENLFLRGIHSFLEGIVVGENAQDEQILALCTLLTNRDDNNEKLDIPFKIRRILFGMTNCKIENLKAIWDDWFEILKNSCAYEEVQYVYQQKKP